MSVKLAVESSHHTSWKECLPHAIALDVHRNRALIGQFTARTFQLRFKGSTLGILWTVLQPLLMFGLYTFVFGIIFGGRYHVIPDETGLDYALGVFLSLTLFSLVAETLGSSPTGVIVHTNLVKKVRFPLQILAISQVGAALIGLGISLVLAVIGMVYFGRGVQTTWLLFPLLLPPLIFLCLGLAWLFSALGVFLRDLSQFVQFLTMALLYSSGVFFSFSPAIIPEAIYGFLQLNPLIHLIESTRSTLLWGIAPSAGTWLFLYLSGLATLFLGYFVFKKLRPAFADVL